MTDILEYFTKPYESYTTIQIILEFSAAFLGILSVYFATKNNILVFPTGIVSTGIYVYILFTGGLFGDMTVNFYYLIMSFIGWYLWTKKDSNDVELPISKATAKELLQSLALFLVSFVFVIGVYIFFRWIGKESFQQIFHFNWINYVDAFTTSIFFAGMWLMAKRKIENWIFWLIGNTLVIPMFLEKGYGITAVQYVIFLILAIIGYRNWRKEVRNYELLSRL